MKESSAKKMTARVASVRSLHVEGWKRNCLTHHTLWLKTVCHVWSQLYSCTQDHTWRSGNRRVKKKRFYTQHILIENSPHVWCLLLWGRWRSNITCRPGSERKKKQVASTHGAIENKPVPVEDTYFLECMKEPSAWKITAGVASVRALRVEGWKRN